MFIVFLKKQLSWSLGSFLSKEFGPFEAGAAAWTADHRRLLTREPHWARTEMGRLDAGTFLSDAESSGSGVE